MSGNINEKLYVTFHEERSRVFNDVTKQWEDNPEPSRLGYAAAYKLGNAKTDKKNTDQFEWARYTFDYAGNFIERSNYRRVWPDGKSYEYGESRQEFMDDRGYAITEQLYDTTPLKDSLKPIVIDNIPREGFKVASTVSRCTTSNKLWRILDPLGFELEISTANMEDLIMTGVIDKGVFEGFLIWDFGKNGIGKATLKRV